jgi:hypothetical protein
MKELCKRFKKLETRMFDIRKEHESIRQEMAMLATAIDHELKVKAATIIAGNMDVDVDNAPF